MEGLEDQVSRQKKQIDRLKTELEEEASQNHRDLKQMLEVSLCVSLVGVFNLSFVSVSFLYMLFSTLNSPPHRLEDKTRLEYATVVRVRAFILLLVLAVLREVAFAQKVTWTRGSSACLSLLCNFSLDSCLALLGPLSPGSSVLRSRACFRFSSTPLFLSFWLLLYLVLVHICLLISFCQSVCCSVLLAFVSICLLQQKLHLTETRRQQMHQQLQEAHAYIHQ